MDSGNTNPLSRGIFTISLDFELMWGMIDNRHATNYKESNVKNVPVVINHLLNAFKKHNLHATFAIVGFIYFKNPQELLNEVPSLLPEYNNEKLNPYLNSFISSIPENEYPLYFAPNLIQRISEVEGMEIGTHTFSHYYCWESGQSLSHFEEDIKKAKEIASAKGINVTTIIFPRNNVSRDYLDICKRFGIDIYRGNPDKFFNQKRGRLPILFQAACRLIDNYINLSGSTSFPVSKVKENGMFNIKASRILRPYSSKLSLLEALRLRRIKKEMTKAAKEGEIYHIWWHPHNFGANIENNFAFLEKILSHFDYLRSKYGMYSFNMHEVANLVR